MFNIVRNILQYKRRLALTINDGFSTFVGQRWLSFNLPDNDVIRLNERINTNRAIHDNPQAFHDMTMVMFSKQSGYPVYVKGEKPPREKKHENFEECASDLGIRQSDLRTYLTIDPHILDRYNKSRTISKLRK